MTLERFANALIDRLNNIVSANDTERLLLRFPKQIKHAYNKIDWEKLEKEYDASCNWKLILNNLADPIARDIYEKGVKIGMYLS